MNINVFIKITSAVAILFGIGWLLAPEFMEATYGLKPNDVAILTTRFLGLTHIGWGMSLKASLFNRTKLASRVTVLN
jgi:hypothetical protein